MEPTILMNVPMSSDAYKEEIFGPVVIVNTFKNEAEALEEANGMEFGLFCESLPLTYDYIMANPVQRRFIQKISKGPCELPKLWSREL